jgi:ankyrin repeat protein
MSWTPLHFSSSLCNFAVCRLLLQRGADPQAKGAEYYPPLSPMRAFKQLPHVAFHLAASRLHCTSPLQMVTFKYAAL